MFVAEGFRGGLDISVVALNFLIVAQFVLSLFVLYFVGVLPFVSAWQRRKRLKRAGFVKHRVGVFASRFSRKATQQRVAARLSDHALLWAYALPDHRTSAKNIVLQELIRRRYTERQIAEWVPDAKEITVPPTFRKPVTRDRYMRMVRARARSFTIFRVSLVMLPVALLGTPFAIALVKNLESADPLISGLFIATLGLGSIVYGLFFGDPLWTSIRSRRRALRILLLRPFGEKRMTKALRRFVPQNIGRVGYVFTLSDRNYRPGLLFTLLSIMSGLYALIALFFVSPFIRDSFRIASIRKERDFRKLERFLLRQFKPSYYSFLTGGQAFNIHSTDAWWKLCIQMLMRSCDVIVLDLSKVKQGTDWELGEIRARSLLSKCLFVVSEDAVQQAHAILAQYFGAKPPPIFTYRTNGQMFDPEIFQDYFGAVALPYFADR